MRQSSDGIEGWMDGRGRWDGGNLWSFISESLEFPLFKANNSEHIRNTYNTDTGPELRRDEICELQFN